MSYSHLAGLIFNRAQLATPELMFSAIEFAKNHLGLIAPPQAGQGIAALAPRLALDDNDGDEEGMPPVNQSGVAVIGIYGPLVPRAGNLEACQRMTSYESIASQLDNALADPTVSHIVLDIDTPGGAATGAFELADKIRTGCAEKPISAIVNFSAFSGGYLIASACSDISLSQSGGVGSIGVIAKHVDLSAALAEQGAVITTVYRGAHKNDLAPDVPLSDASLAFLNATVDRIYAQFVGAVAAYRGLSANKIAATEAGLYFGQDAINAGLADRLESPQDAINRIAGEVAAQRAAPLPIFQTPQRLRLTAQAIAIQAAL